MPGVGSPGVAASPLWLQLQPLCQRWVREGQNVVWQDPSLSGLASPSMLWTVNCSIVMLLAATM